MPKLSKVVHTDTEMKVVNAALDAPTEILKVLKGLVLKSEDHLDAVVMCIKNVFNKTPELWRSEFFFTEKGLLRHFTLNGKC